MKWFGNIQTFVGMCRVRNQIFLSGTEERFIRWCTQCRKFAIHLEGFDVSFCKTGLKGFRHALSRLEDEHFQYYFSDEPKVLIRCRGNDQAVFLSRAEVDELLDLINQAILMQDARNLLEL